MAIIKVKKKFLLLTFSIAILTLVVGCGLTTSPKTKTWEIPPPPTLQHPIVDETNTLTSSQKILISKQIYNTPAPNRAQIAVLITDVVHFGDIAEDALRVARAWNPGVKNKQNGILLYIALNDRQVRIETASKNEGLIPDIAAKNIIDTAIVPNFQAGDYVRGISNAVLALRKLTDGEADYLPGEKFLPNNSDTNYTGYENWIYVPIVVIFVLILLFSSRGRPTGYTYGGSGFDYQRQTDDFFGGGGGFSGGGASGRW